MLTSRVEREAVASLKLLLQMLVQRATGRREELPEEETELLELFVHELIEAAAEKGRAQIR